MYCGILLDILITYVSFDVYKLFSERTDFKEAINIIKIVFVQEKVKYALGIYLQLELNMVGETLVQYLQALHVIAKDYKSNDVTA